MKFVTVRDLRGKTAALWKQLEQEKELVVTSNGKPIAVLSATDENSLESCLRALRQERANDALGKLQRDAEKRELHRLSSKDIQAEVDKSRKRRRVG
jgi:prevent-host-death family protein